MSFPLIPHYAVLDARATYSLPPHLTATTGMDALTHALEAYIGRSGTSETRALALRAVRLIFENILRAYNDGKDHTARENMLVAAYNAGCAFSKSYVGYIHAIAHSLGGKYGTAHGLANAVLMPVMLSEYGDCIHGRLKELALAAGVCEVRDERDVAAKKFILAIEELNERMNIPKTLSEIRREDIAVLAAHAEKEANPLYPVPRLLTRRELEIIYYKVGEFYEKD